MKIKNPTIIALTLSLIISAPLISQTNEIGLFAGGSLFHGDVGYQNAEYSILNTKPVIGLNFKRNFNYHFGLLLSFNKSTIQANDNVSTDEFNINRNIDFKSKINEFSLILEFNFHPYLSRDTDHNTTSFIFTGISKFYFNPQNKYDGRWYNVQPLTTEGQNSDLYPSREIYSLNGWAIPIGMGYKVNIYNSITLAFNIGWRITWIDYIDDVSTTYVEESILNQTASELANQSNNNLPSKFQRGNPYNNDKYGFIGINILYSIKDRNNGCDNIVY
ncbi:MAG: hypothetical protein CMD23_02840 [Flavobacteriales bacterium]|nr:hypothetical protein [Flavobacteriales bacterium]|tara:strand:- start:5058 stop:5882 length:825 start_codon:yes stop_codon:yes gene_type:complete